MLKFEDFFQEGAGVELSGLKSSTGSKTKIAFSISRGPDNGANNMAARVFNSKNRHLTTREAFDTLIRLIPVPPVFPGTDPPLYDTEPIAFMLCGHGSPGGFDTGSGDLGIGFSNRMSRGSYSSWMPIVKDIGVPTDRTWVTELIFLSCDTGAGYEGALFLFEVAKEIGCTVMARTGITFYNAKTYFFEKNSTWQKARESDEQMPNPIELPPRIDHKHYVNSDTVTELLKDLNTDLLSISNISINIFTTPPVEKTVYKSNIQNFLTHVFGTPLIENPAIIAGEKTGIITISLVDKPPIIAIIYNDRYAIISDKGCGFYIGTSFLNAVSQL